MRRPGARRRRGRQPRPRRRGAPTQRRAWRRGRRRGRRPRDRRRARPRATGSTSRSRRRWSPKPTSAGRSRRRSLALGDARWATLAARSAAGAPSAEAEPLGVARSRAWARELVGELVDAVLERLEPARQRAQPLLEPLDVAAGGDVERAHRGALRRSGPLAGAQGPGERRIEERILDQRLGQLAHGFLAASADSAAIVVDVHRARSVAAPQPSSHASMLPMQGSGGIPCRPALTVRSIGVQFAPPVPRCKARLQQIAFASLLRRRSGAAARAGFTPGRKRLRV